MKTPKDKSVSELIKDHRNANKHSEKGMQMLKDGIIKNGLGRSILLSADDEIIAGNGVTEAAEKIGIQKVKIIETDGTEIIAVKRTDIKSGTKEFYEMALSDNIIAKENIVMDAEVVDAICEEYGIEDYKTQSEQAEAQEDDYEIPDEIKTDIVLGDLFEIGPHRLLCGDSTDSDQVSKLMVGGKADMVFTDPPYNINYGNIKHHTVKQREIENDNMSKSNFKDFCCGFISNITLFNKGCVYIAGPPGPDGRIMFTEADNALHCSTVIIWNKDQFTLGRGKYQNKYEPIWFGWVDNGTSFYGDRKQTNVWDIARPKKSPEHPTMKPVELVSKAINHASRKDDVVLDLFAGSGTTMVAAHQTKRRAFVAELDPKYCQVIVDRMVKLEPEIEIKRNGKPYEPKPKA